MKCAWRIAADTPAYGADDRMGIGAKLSGGRWNSKGNPILYCADSIALAALETLVHLQADSLPLHRYLVRFEIPDSIWKARVQLAPESAPDGWDACFPGFSSVDHGNRWLADATSALLCVPSVIVPEECNILVNPLHSDTASINVAKRRHWHYDGRLINRV